MESHHGKQAIMPPLICKSEWVLTLLKGGILLGQILKAKLINLKSMI